MQRGVYTSILYRGRLRLKILNLSMNSFCLSLSLYVSLCLSLSLSVSLCLSLFLSVSLCLSLSLSVSLCLYLSLSVSLCLSLSLSDSLSLSNLSVSLSVSLCLSFSLSFRGLNLFHIVLSLAEKDIRSIQNMLESLGLLEKARAVGK